MSNEFDGKSILVTGGTGSLGQVLTRRLLEGSEMGRPSRVIIFSRDEAKQHFMRMQYLHKAAATDEIIYRDFKERLDFRIGDVRDLGSVISVLRDADIVFNAAALKQVPTCEYFPFEAVRTNVGGAENIVRAIQEHDLPVQTVVGISTDKACKPVNVMGMTKAIQERLFIQANMRGRRTRFVCARYGNVLASRGSVIPLFHDQIRNGGPVTLTTVDMTRFLLSLDEAVDTIFAAVRFGAPGDTFIPRVPSALVSNVAKALIGDRNIELKVTGIRPGEKTHESLISAEEALRTVTKGGCYAIRPMLPELSSEEVGPAELRVEYSSKDDVMTLEETKHVLQKSKLMYEDRNVNFDEILA